jgi:hypothetical protein
MNPRLLLPAALLLAPLLRAPAAPTNAPAASAPVPTTEAARDILRKWVETRQLVSKEEEDWKEGRELLQARVDLLHKQLSELDAKLVEARKSVADADAKKAELDKQNNALKAIAANLATTVTGLEGGVREMVKIVPEGMREKLTPLLTRMPEDPATTKVSLAERFQNVVGILNEVTRLTSEVVLVTELRPIGDGKPQELRTVYVGLAQAYFVNAQGNVAGIGLPGKSGWEWRQENDLAPNISAAIEILQNKRSPGFVQLPVKIQ